MFGVEVCLSNEDKRNIKIRAKGTGNSRKRQKHKPYRHKIMDNSLVPESKHGVGKWNLRAFSY